jgi:hypothetical protein
MRHPVLKCFLKGSGRWGSLRWPHPVRTAPPFYELLGSTFLSTPVSMGLMRRNSACRASPIRCFFSKPRVGSGFSLLALSCSKMQWAGVEAGRRGGFGRVIGVDRGHQADALRERGADNIVQSLLQVEVVDI